MANPILIYEVRDEIAFITMNRPEKLNALNGELSMALKAAWIRFQNDDDARVAVFKGAGRAFCAGADQTPGQLDPNVPFQSHEGYPPNGMGLFKPVVAAVRGYAYGAGYALAIRGSDITICSENAQIGFPEARVGVPIPPITYLPYLPFKMSLELMLLGWNGGRLMSAQRAHQLGLVNAVVPDDQLEDEAVRWAELFKRIPPLYIKSVKAGHYKSAYSSSRLNELEYIEYVWPQMISEDRAEAKAAFQERREPKFKGR
jgi:enoyl-CoA hydratase/carnithine racemase